MESLPAVFQWGKRPLGILAMVLAAGLGSFACARHDGVPADRRNTVKGRVTSELGQPLQGATVSLKQGRTVRNAITVSDGQFAIPDVPDGEYAARAAMPGHVALELGQISPYDLSRRAVIGRTESELFDFVLPTAKVIRGTVRWPNGTPVRGATATLFREAFETGIETLKVVRAAPPGQSVTNEIGDFFLPDVPEGLYYLRLARQAVFGGVVDGTGQRRQVVSSTYYPGVACLTSATPIKVSKGPINLNVTLVPQDVIKLAVSVVTSDGLPAPSAVIRSVPPKCSGHDPRIVRGAETGRIVVTIPRVPGIHEVTASVSPSEGGLSEGEAGRSALEVNDVTGLSTSLILKTSSLGVIRGRVDRSTAMMPRLIFARATSDNGWPTSVGAQIQSDGRFRISGLRGHVWLSSGEAETGAAEITSVKHDGFEIAEIGVRLGPSDVVTDVTVAFDRPFIAIKGVVTSEGRPVQHPVVLAFSAGESHWVDPLRRYVRSVWGGPDGRFEIPLLFEGPTLLVAFKSLDESIMTSPAFLRSLRPIAQLVDVRRGATASLTLPVSVLRSR